ncbi:TMEM175 family protein [Ferruginibacter yonginensis]|uniref:TMEM175 family protein n=1 Tax=Ferruginibacter yonginensis TaxID=1310416 RepID=A0ABV8QSI9_9BACT
MKKNRVEAFSDGVIAIIITIMVLELKVPHGNQLHDLKSLLPIALSYVLSFVNVGLYWNNHHHLFQAVEKINGKVLWANTHLLFWLSLMPFSTAWMGENDFTKWPVILYGFILMMSGIAYFILVRTLLPIHQKDTALAKAIGNDFKGKFSVIVYSVAVIIGYWSVTIALILYVVVAATWLIPDKRIEEVI